MLGPVGKLRRTHVRRRADDASGKRRQSSRGGSTHYVEENIDPADARSRRWTSTAELLFSRHHARLSARTLNRFQPFGPGNNGASLRHAAASSNHGDAKLVGMECEHLRMDLMQRQKPNTKIQAIAFQQPTHYEWVRSGTPDRRLLPDRRKPLPGNCDHPAPDQGHQTRSEQVVSVFEREVRNTTPGLSFSIYMRHCI